MVERPFGSTFLDRLLIRIPQTDIRREQFQDYYQPHLPALKSYAWTYLLTAVGGAIVLLIGIFVLKSFSSWVF
jgi:hypothetical protein